MSEEALHIVIIGGVAGGASAAARARRHCENARITLIERGPDVSFANCGLPYYIGGEITERSRLAVQTPESLKGMLNVDVMTHTEVTAIERDSRHIRLRDVKTGETRAMPYDKLVLAPGAAPVRPPLPGIDDPRILTLRNLQDMDAISSAAEGARRVTVVGAGFIGLEMAEQLRHRGKEVTVVELMEQVLPQMDPEMTRPIADELRQHGVEVILGDGIASFEGSERAIAARLKSGNEVAGELVVLSIGVRPESGLAKDAGLELGERGHIVVNEWQQTSDPVIYAAGDAVETADAVMGGRTAVPLGGPANRQGRIAADHIFQGAEATPYPGSLGTAIVRVFDIAAAVTGWTGKRLKQAGIEYGTTTVTAFNHAGYYPGATPVTVKVIWEKESGRLIGAQAFGADGVDKRIDVLATAVRARMNVEELAHLELAYAPPFGAARDVVNMAGFSAENIRRGFYEPVYEKPGDGEAQLVDVRPTQLFEVKPMAGARNIPLPELRSRLGELDRDKPVITTCALGKMSYFAARVLEDHGFEAKTLVGGATIHAEAGGSSNGGSDRAGTGSGHRGNNGEHGAAAAPRPASEPAGGEHGGPGGSGIEPARLDATGLACPGPIMRVKQAAGELQPGQELVIRASDSGFASDLPAFCRANGLEFLGAEKEKGITVGHLRRPAQEAQPAAREQAGLPAGNGATLVVFSGELDKAMASLVIANGAVAMGGPVTVFFTFWGLNVLRREQPPAIADKSLMDKLFGWMMPRGVHRLPLSKMHYMGAGTRMLKHRMASKDLPSLPGLLEDARKAGVRLVACSMSMEAMGIRREELLDDVEVGGVAEFLGAANETRANFFI